MPVRWRSRLRWLIVLPSDTAFEVFLATVMPSDFNDWEFQLYRFHKLTGEQ